MKRLALILFGTLLTTTAQAGSPGGPFGLGLSGGTQVNGLSGKYYMGGTALQGTVGIQGLGNDGGDHIGLTLDYLLEQPDLASTDPVNIAWNFGVGGALGLGDNYLGLGVAGIAGLEFNFNPVPIDVVLEYRPTLAVIPDIDLDLVGFSSHIRWYF